MDQYNRLCAEVKYFPINIIMKSVIFFVAYCLAILAVLGFIMVELTEFVRSFFKP